PELPALAANTPDPAEMLAASVRGPDDIITVYKAPTCGCCGNWVEHLRENGFTVNVVEESAMLTVKTGLGVPSGMHSCHTAVVGGEIIEGHVPADVLRDYLADEATRSASIGLSVPGMPIGSPGMEIEGAPADAYDVVTFSETGSATYASR
ncbi:MAG: DUF411 domain-containing protein, partial [Longimicrobiales bacterium]|nr:DUF411 domain-containing protein [Longimicrobiales bacterium]